MEARNDPFSWQKGAACKSLPSTYFFEDERLEKGGDHRKEAGKETCITCPVRWECLDTSILYGFEGVWGGFNDKERRELYDGYREQLLEERQEIGTYKPLPHIAA